MKTQKIIQTTHNSLNKTEETRPPKKSLGCQVPMGHLNVERTSEGMKPVGVLGPWAALWTT